jgi:hypothetical protein
MTYVVAALLLSGFQSSPPGTADSTAIAPQVIYWVGAGPADRKTEIGLLYTPECWQLWRAALRPSSFPNASPMQFVSRPPSWCSGLSHPSGLNRRGRGRSQPSL